MDCYNPSTMPDPPAHQHGPNSILQSYPLDGHPCCGPEHHHHGHHDHHHHDDFCPEPPHIMPQCPPEKCDPLPPPIPPVRYVPGMNVQEQLTSMANHVNTAIDRWNQIQAKCYEALNRTVGAAVHNDVYYEPCEVNYTEGFSAADNAKYELVEAACCDAAGHPIHLKLVTAYSARNGSTRQPIQDASFVTSANAIITARMTQWSGLAMIGGNPIPTVEAIPDTYYVATTCSGQLLIVPQEMATIEDCCRRQIVDMIGPVIPIVEYGKPTNIAKNFQNDTPAAIQAIGWKKCNGHRVMFSCGYQENPGCTVSNVANLLSEMGVTTAVITCYQKAYASPDIAGFPQTENAASTFSMDVTPGDDSMGLTGGMLYIGNIADRPLNFQMPSNAAFWVISKRPPHGWHNRFTAEIADICQKLGYTANSLSSISGKIDIEQKILLDLQNRVGKLESNDSQQDIKLENHEQRITTLEREMDTAQADITQLQSDLAKETQARIDADTQIVNALNREIQERTDEDNRVRNEVNLIRTALTEEITARNQADQDLINALNNETNARMAADQALKSQIDLIDTKNSGAIQAETAARIAADEKLQEQIDKLSGSVNFKAGAGIIKKFLSGNVTEIAANIGAGLRFDGLSRIAVDTGKGLAIVNGKVVPKLSEDFIINEKGEIEMVCNCCNCDPTEAGVGLEYAVDETTGKKSINVIPATDKEIGGVKAGPGITISPDGTISANGGGGGGQDPYTLPTATATTLGGVKIGDNITIDADGKISTHAPYVLPIATATQLGGVRAGKNIVIDEDGIINAEIPESPGEGDTVLTGTGIYIEKNAEERTATISLSEQTQATLAQVGDIKNEVDQLNTDLTQGLNRKVNVSTFNESQAAQDAKINTAVSDAASAQEQAAQANAAVEELASRIPAEGEFLKTTGGEVTGSVEFTGDEAGKTVTVSDGGVVFDRDVTVYKENSALVIANKNGANVTLSGVKNGTSPSDAVNYAQLQDVEEQAVDALSDAATALQKANECLPLSGGTMTGNIVLGSNSIKGPGNAQAFITATGIAIANDDTTTERPAVKLTGLSSNRGAIIAPATTTETSAVPVKLIGIATPTADGDAVNKKYVDDAVKNIEPPEGDYLPTSGGTMTGSIKLPMNSANNPVRLEGASTTPSIQFYQGAIQLVPVGGVPTGSFPQALTLAKQGGGLGLIPRLTQAPDIGAESNLIQLNGVATPINNSDAANKKYVDTAVDAVDPDGKYLKLMGGKMTGAIDMNNFNFTNLNTSWVNEGGAVSVDFLQNEVIEGQDLIAEDGLTFGAVRRPMKIGNSIGNLSFFQAELICMKTLAIGRHLIATCSGNLVTKFGSGTVMVNTTKKIIGKWEHQYSTTTRTDTIYIKLDEEVTSGTVLNLDEFISLNALNELFSFRPVSQDVVTLSKLSDTPFDQLYITSQHNNNYLVGPNNLHFRGWIFCRNTEKLSKAVIYKIGKFISDYNIMPCKGILKSSSGYAGVAWIDNEFDGERMVPYLYMMPNVNFIEANELSNLVF